jgi:Rrf2 family iron-sulfur cluster assembly transcriptional regulator
MNLTSKSRYALKIMMDLAHYGAQQPLVRRSEIAARQGIPTDYLDQIMIKLRSGHLVESTRGRSGGYRLSRSADDISMWDLFSAVEESVIPVECISSGNVCDFERSCSSRDAWGTIFSALKSSLGGISLGQLARQWASEATGLVANQLRAASATDDHEMVQECRGGGRFENHQANLVSTLLNLDQGARLDG